MVATPMDLALFIISTASVQIGSQQSHSTARIPRVKKRSLCLFLLNNTEEATVVLLAFFGLLVVGTSIKSFIPGCAVQENFRPTVTNE